MTIVLLFLSSDLTKTLINFCTIKILTSNRKSKKRFYYDMVKGSPSLRKIKPLFKL